MFWAAIRRAGVETSLWCKPLQPSPHQEAGCSLAHGWLWPLWGGSARGAVYGIQQTRAFLETRPIPGTVTKGCLTVHKPTYDTHLPRSLGAWPPKLQETHLRRAGSRIWMSASLLRALTKPRSPGATGHLTHCADQDPLVFKSGLRFYRAWSLYK